MQHQNREAWLNFVAQKMAPMFAELNAPLPSRIRIAIGFLSSGNRGKRIGECWDNICSADGHFEIFIKPTLVETPEAMPSRVADILAHELVHAAVGIPEGHRKEFRRVAIGLGLTGKMTATVAGPEFIKRIAPILAEAGPLPHARIDPSRTRDNGEDGKDERLTTSPKKQVNRHIKTKCKNCGYSARTSKKWLEKLGPPHCPAHGVMQVDDDQTDGGDD